MLLNNMLIPFYLYMNAKLSANHKAEMKNSFLINYTMLLQMEMHTFSIFMII